MNEWNEIRIGTARMHRAIGYVQIRSNSKFLPVVQVKRQLIPKAQQQIIIKEIEKKTDDTASVICVMKCDSILAPHQLTTTDLKSI